MIVVGGQVDRGEAPAEVGRRSLGIAEERVQPVGSAFGRDHRLQDVAPDNVAAFGDGGVAPLFITAPAADPSRARSPLDSSLVNVGREHRLDANLLAAGLELFVRYPLRDHLFLFGGPALNYLMKHDAVHTEVITDPSWAVFSDTKTATRTLSSGAIPSANSIIATATLGAAIDLPLSDKVNLSPELSVTLPLSSVRSDHTWHVTTVALGAHRAQALVSPGLTRPVHAGGSLAFLRLRRSGKTR